MWESGERTRTYHTFSGWIHLTVRTSGTELSTSSVAEWHGSCRTQMVWLYPQSFQFNSSTATGPENAHFKQVPRQCCYHWSRRRIWEPFENPRGPSQSTLSKTQIWRDRLIISFRAHPPPSSFSPYYFIKIHFSLAQRPQRKLWGLPLWSWWLRLHPPTQGIQVQYLVKELGSHMQKPKNVKQKQCCIKFNNFKTVHNKKIFFSFLKKKKTLTQTNVSQIQSLLICDF